MAEAVFSKVIKDLGQDSKFDLITSYGTAGYHVGEEPDYRTVDVCEKHEVPINHRAQRITSKQFNEFDYIICMDRNNLRNLQHTQPRGKCKAQLHLFGEWKEDSKLPRIVEDPYYGGEDGFEFCYRQCVHFSKIFAKRELDN